MIWKESSVEIFCEFLMQDQEGWLHRHRDSRRISFSFLLLFSFAIVSAALVFFSFPFCIEKLLTWVSEVTLYVSTATMHHNDDDARTLFLSGVMHKCVCLSFNSFGILL